MPACGARLPHRGQWPVAPSPSFRVVGITSPPRRGNRSRDVRYIAICCGRRSERRSLPRFSGAVAMRIISDGLLRSCNSDISAWPRARRRYACGHSIALETRSPSALKLILHLQCSGVAGLGSVSRRCSTRRPTTSPLCRRATISWYTAVLACALYDAPCAPVLRLPVSPPRDVLRLLCADFSHAVHASPARDYGRHARYDNLAGPTAVVSMVR